VGATKTEVPISVIVATSNNLPLPASSKSDYDSSSNISTSIRFFTPLVLGVAAFAID
jgi:hypothetical protein